MNDDGWPETDHAEKVIAGALSTLQEANGFSLHRDVLLGRSMPDGSPARLDFVLVDRQGVLVVDTQTPQARAVTGRYTDDTWYASDAGFGDRPIGNPIRRNDQRVGLVHELVTEAGWPLTLDQVRGMVVFADTDISRVALDSVNSARIADVGELAERYAKRRDLPTTKPLSGEEVESLSSVVAGLAVADDSPGAAAVATPTAMPEPPAEPAAEMPIEPALEMPDERYPMDVSIRRALWFAAGFVALVAVVMVAVVVVRAFVRSEPPELPSAPAPSTPAATPVPTITQPPATEPEPVAKPDVALAKRRLKEEAPDAYWGLMDADHPEITDVVDGQITYEWDYTDRQGSSSVRIKHVSITLDAEGKVIGLSR